VELDRLIGSRRLEEVAPINSLVKRAEWQVVMALGDLASTLENDFTKRKGGARDRHRHRLRR
jgi:hypothetical protein